MLKVNRSANHGCSPPLYKGNLAARQTELTIFVFANGDESVSNQARRFELCKFDLLAWNPTLDAIATRMGLRKKGIKSLYTRGGRRINGYWELTDGGCYVGVGPHERFRKLNYYDPACELFKSKTQARKQTEKENEFKAFNRESAPFFCSTSMPMLNLVQDIEGNNHRNTKDSPFLHSTKRNSTYSPSKPSKSVEELRRIYNRSSNVRRSRRVLTSSIPYYKRVKPEENGRSSSLDLATGESTKARIGKFSSKYLPYYSKLQQKFLDQTRDKGAKKSPVAKGFVSKRTSEGVDENNSATKPSLRVSGVVLSVTSRVIHADSRADVSTNSSFATLTKTSQTAHTNTPANMSSQSSVAISKTSQTVHTNTPANLSSQSSIAISKTSQTSHTNTPANISSQSSIAISKTSQTAHTNTPANMSSQSSVAILSKTSPTAHTNTPAKVSLQSSFAISSKTPQAAQTNGLMDESSPSSSETSSESCQTVDSPTNPSPGSRASVANGTAAATCLAISKPKSLSYFLDLSEGGGMLEEWGEGEEEIEGGSSTEDETEDYCQAESIVDEWSNDRPSTRSTEYPEETEETLVDYWFMSEDDFEDESSDDLEEGGLKMKFLQLD